MPHIGLLYKNIYMFHKSILYSCSHRSPFRKKQTDWCCRFGIRIWRLWLPLSHDQATSRSSWSLLKHVGHPKIVNYSWKWTLNRIINVLSLVKKPNTKQKIYRACFRCMYMHDCIELNYIFFMKVCAQSIWRNLLDKIA